MPEKQLYIFRRIKTTRGERNWPKGFLILPSENIYTRNEEDKTENEDVSNIVLHYLKYLHDKQYN